MKTHQRGKSTPALVSWAMYDWANSAYATLIQTFVFAAYFTRSVSQDEIVGSAHWGTTTGVAGLLIAAGGPILGAVADQTGRRKPWILWFTLLAVITTALLWFVKPSPDYVLFAMLMVILGTIGVEYGMIFYNAMLPDLAPEEKLGRWSGWSWALGYGGGLACLVVALVAFVRAESPWLDLDREALEHVRITFPLAAVWILLFALPLFVITPDSAPTGKRLGQAARDGLRQLWHSFLQVRRYVDIVRFLIARMIYTDGLTTLFTFGGVYAAGTFHMTEQEVLMFGIALNVTAGLGALAFAWVDDWAGSKQTILLSLVGLTVPAAFMLITESAAVFWTLGLVLGIFVGPVQAASRAYMARVAPPELRTEMFGLLAFSGKATAFLGPVLVGWLTFWSGSQRIGMSTVVAFFVVGFLVMLTVPAAKKRV